MEYSDTFWVKRVVFACTDCGYIMTGEDHAQTRYEYSAVHDTEMSFFVCPTCGKEAIVLW